MKLIVGVDEAGRGPIAGPVAVGAVLAPQDFDFLTAFPGLNDSKKLTEKKREELFERLLVSKEVRFSVKSVGADLIDRAGITRCVRRAVHASVRELAPEPTDVHVYLDGLLSAPEEYPQETVVGGDSRIPAIMLASVAAKVSRDRLMVRLGEAYPAYGFERHKGYGTAGHRKAIEIHGLCSLHRKTYCTSFA